jgi:uncharacterized membrane protein
MVRLLRHVFALPGVVARAFPGSALHNIEAAIAQGEKQHGGELRFAVEAALDPLPLLRGQTARERALEAFAELRVWDTEANNGVLLYLLLADRDVEIVADRGFNAAVPREDWEQVCRAMEAELRAGRYEAGALEGLRRIAVLMARPFPPRARRPDELSNRAALL